MSSIMSSGVLWWDERLLSKVGYVWVFFKESLISLQSVVSGGHSEVTLFVISTVHPVVEGLLFVLGYTNKEWGGNVTLIPVIRLLWKYCVPFSSVYVFKRLATVQR